MSLRPLVLKSSLECETIVLCRSVCNQNPCAATGYCQGANVCSQTETSTNTICPTPLAGAGVGGVAAASGQTAAGRKSNEILV